MLLQLMQQPELHLPDLAPMDSILLLSGKILK